jgi:hypothetical protein
MNSWTISSKLYWNWLKETCCGTPRGVLDDFLVDFGFVFGLIAHGSLYRMLAIISRCKRPRIVRLKEI